MTENPAIQTRSPPPKSPWPSSQTRIRQMSSGPRTVVRNSHADARAHSHSSLDVDIFRAMEQKPSNQPRRRTRQSGTGDPLPHASGLSPAKRLAYRKEPPPDLTAMYAEYNRLYFGNALHSFTIQWSNSQTRCSGITFFDRRLISISSRILRDPRMPHEDLVDTIHEMIHVHLFLNGHRAESVNHGPRFRQQMRRINAAGRHHITVDHLAAEKVVPRYGWVCSSRGLERTYSEHASPYVRDWNHGCTSHCWLPILSTT